MKILARKEAKKCNNDSHHPSLIILSFRNRKSEKCSAPSEPEMSVLHISALQISPCSLINFDTLEESLEVSSSEALVVASLDDFNEDCWTILDWFGEYLQEVAVIIVVNQDLQFLQSGQVLLHLHLRVGQSSPEEIIIAVRNVEKLLSSGSQVGNGLDDIMGPVGQQRGKLETNVCLELYSLIQPGFTSRRYVELQQIHRSQQTPGSGTSSSPGPAH